MDLRYSIIHPEIDSEARTAEEVVLFIFRKQLHKENFRATCTDLTGGNVSFDGIEVEFNIYSGDVRTIDTNEPSAIHNEYSFLTDPIVNAIKLISILNLLYELDKLNDNKISNIIKKMTNKNLPRLEDANSTLEKIIRECSRGVRA